MEVVDKSGEPRSLEDLIEARDAIKKDMIMGKPIPHIWVHYTTIIHAIDELIRRRSQEVGK